MLRVAHRLDVILTDLDPSDLASLAALDALLQEASVTRAAKRLGLSTPAVSHALARLRDRFDDPLLVRAGRGMVLTPRAEALKPRARDAVTIAGQVFAPAVERPPEAMDRSFVVSMTDYVLLVFGAAFDAAISGASKLRLRVVPNAVDDAQRLRDGTTDLAVGIYGPLPPELKLRSIITDRLVCVVRGDHPTIGDTLTLDTYLAHEHVQVAPRGRPGGYVDDQLAERGAARRVVRAVPYFQVALEMTAASDRILTVSERIATLLGPRLGLRILDPPLPLAPFALSMVWHPRYDADSDHRWLRNRLAESTQSQQAMAHTDARRRLSPTDPTTGSKG